MDGTVTDVWCMTKRVNPVTALTSRTGRVARAGTEWLLPVLLDATVIVYCGRLAPKRLLWTDERLIWYPFSGSFGSMLGAATDTINSAPAAPFCSRLALVSSDWRIGRRAPAFFGLRDGVARSLECLRYCAASTPHSRGS